MRHQLHLLASVIIGSGACAAQFPSFSFSAGTDGVNFNMSSEPLFPTVVAVPAPYHHGHYFHHAPEPEVCIPLMPGVRYVDVAPSYKAYRKAAKAYRKAARYSGGAPGISVTLPGGITISTPGAAPVYYYDDDDLEDYYDDYRDYIKHRNKEARKHAKKMRKHWEKHHDKHHGKHHHHHDDD